MKKNYKIDEVFITVLGYYNEFYNEFFPIEHCSINEYNYELVILKDNGYFKNINNGEKYKQYRFCTLEELKISLVWGNLIPIYPYLTEKEKKRGIISRKRLMMIHIQINNDRSLNTVGNDNVYTLIPR